MMGSRKTNTGGHSQGAIDAQRDAPDLARYNHQVTIITIDPPRTSVLLFHCEQGVRYLDLHTGEFGLGGGSLRKTWRWAGWISHCRCGQILAYLRQDAPKVPDAEPSHVLSYAEPTRPSADGLAPQ
jgi:hypothetical protein